MRPSSPAMGTSPPPTSSASSRSSCDSICWSDATVKCAYSSEPSDSSTSMCARNVVPRLRTSPTSEASSKFSGRMPAISWRPCVLPSLLCSSEGSRTSASGSLMVSPSTVAGMKFIAGDPMKPATNRFSG